MPPSRPPEAGEPPAARPDGGRSGGRYGSRQWLDDEYARADDDPWGLDRRASQQLRYQRMLAVLARTIATGPAPARIVDIGCATGAFTARLGRKVRSLAGDGVADEARIGTSIGTSNGAGDGAGDGPGVGECELIGTDIAAAAIERARARHPGVRFECLDSAAVAARWPGQVDGVVALEVLYYLPDAGRDAMLADIATLLRPGGWLLTSSMIARPPYLTLAELRARVAAHLTVVESGVIGLRMINLFERAAMRAGRLGARLTGRRGPGWPGRPPSARAIQRAAALERLSIRLLGTASHSHGYVLARKA